MTVSADISIESFWSLKLNKAFKLNAFEFYLMEDFESQIMLWGMNL